MTKRIFHLFSAFSFIFCILTAAVLAQPELDISFNGTGRVTTDFSSGYDIVYGALVQADDKIVAVGTYSENINRAYFALTRYNTNGTLDTSFGDNGRVLTDFDTTAADQGVFAAALQPDGKILATGFVSFMPPGPGAIATARYNPNGSLDTTFGTGGKVETAVVNHINEARAIAVGQDGKIVVAGYYFGPNQNYQTVIVRYDANGGSGGITTDTRGFQLGESNIANGVAIQPDGKIVTAGGYSSGQSGSAGSDLTMLRLTPSGAYDTTFVGGGRLLVPSPGVNEALSAVAVQPDGRIVAAGGSNGSLLVMRFNADGSPDTTFNLSGRVTTAMGGNSQATGLIVRPNGKIVVSGLSGADFAVACYNPDGSPDTSFSGDGKLTFNFTGNRSYAYSMGIDSLGRIVLGGTSGPNVGIDTSFAVARLYTLDPVPVTIAGRTLTQNGQPIRMMEVALTDSHGVTRYSYTSSLGYFQFDNVMTGQTYDLSVSSKRYTFPGITVGVSEAVNNLDMTGTPLQQRPNRIAEHGRNEKSGKRGE
jgi:uncharacterized delta-60 repeat protein